MFLRDVELGDYDAYVRMRCDPVMMAELGGPQPIEGIAAKVERDVANARADRQWIKMIVPALEHPEIVAGNVCIWKHDEEPHDTEIGWMVLPEFQGRGTGKAAVRLLLERARDDGRWGPIHAFPGVTNAPSNRLCQSLNFTHVAEEVITFANRDFRCNHWVIDPASDLTTS